MIHFRQIDTSHTLFLQDIREETVNSLSLEVMQAGPVGEPHDLKLARGTIEGVTRINSTSKSGAYKVVFDSYVCYKVLNESYSSPSHPHEVFTGNLFRIYTKSDYLDQISIDTCACDGYPGPLRHYCLICADHIIDVVTDQPPEITLLDSRGT